MRGLWRHAGSLRDNPPGRPPRRTASIRMPELREIPSLLARLLAAALAGALAAGAAAGADEPPIIVKLSHVVAVDTPKGRAAELFKRRAEELTGGRVRVEVHPCSRPSPKASRRPATS